MILAEPFPACNSSLWNHINGWEVVVAVLLIMASWAATSIARMYFMLRIAQIGHHLTKAINGKEEET
jgi:hypothetical protein